MSRRRRAKPTSLLLRIPDLWSITWCYVDPQITHTDEWQSSLLHERVHLVRCTTPQVTESTHFIRLLNWKNKVQRWASPATQHHLTRRKCQRHSEHTTIAVQRSEKNPQIIWGLHCEYQHYPHILRQTVYRFIECHCHQCHMKMTSIIIVVTKLETEGGREQLWQTSLIVRNLDKTTAQAGTICSQMNLSESKATFKSR